jgi:NAD(P)H dehydrogenase (quinone)
MIFERHIKMKIGISGASGHLGSAAMIELITKRTHHTIVGISRTPETVPSPAEGRFGDYDDPDTLHQAYMGLDRLAIIPSSDVRPGIRDRHFVTAIDAAVTAGVQHIVMISTAATRESDPSHMYASYWTGEQHLMRTARHWSILRMNYYAESFAQVTSMSLHTGVLLGLGENRVAFVSRDDVAAAAAGILLGNGHAGVIYNATGPASLTGAERAALLSDIARKPLRFEVREEDSLRDTFLQTGMPPEYIGALIDIEKSFLEGCFDIVTGDVERLSGRRPRALRDVLIDKPRKGTSEVR